MTKDKHPAPRIPFIIALLGAPLFMGGILLGFAMLGEYASRFSQAGGAGFLLALPSWLLVFSVLADRGAKEGRVATRDHVFMSLYANLASLILFPAAVLGADLLGADISGMLATEMAGESPPTPLMAGVVTGAASFFLGLFFMPILAWIFSTIGRTLGGLSRV